MFLGTTWRRIVLVISSFPIAVVKNAFRIVTLSLLASYVDKVFITNHWLHRSGGLPFFVIGMVLFFLPLLWWLRASEKKARKRRDAVPAAAGQKGD
jgi:exosortase/archaeosortase family protein